MVIVGDDKQLAPTLMTAGEKLPEPNTETVNRFELDGQVSLLSWFVQNSWPVFHLHTQMRMVNGQFDAAVKIVYPELKLDFKYGQNCKPSNYPLGERIENHLTTTHGIVRRPGKLPPVFINCQDCLS